MSQEPSVTSHESGARKFAVIVFPHIFCIFFLSRVRVASTRSHVSSVGVERFLDDLLVLIVLSMHLIVHVVHVDKRMCLLQTRYLFSR